MHAVDTELAALHAGTSGVTTDHARDELRAFVEVFVRQLSALIKPSDTPEASTGMAQALRRLGDLADALDAESQHRPGVDARAHLHVAHELTRLWPIYREALTTLDMARAQELGNLGQSVLDGAPQSIEHARQVSEAAEVLGGQKVEPSLVRRIQRAMHVLHPGMDWDALLAESARRAHASVGAVVGPGAAMDYLVLDTVASALFDPQVFRIKLREAVSTCADQVRLREIAAMDDAVKGLQHLRRDLVETINQFTQVVDQESRDSAVVRRLAKTAGELYESAMPLLAWYRLLTGDAHGPDRYCKTVEANSTDLVGKVAHHMQRVCADMPKYLRNSAHHGGAFEFNETGASVSIRLKLHKEEMSLDEYLDRVLALVESLEAARWALDEALERAGVDVPLSDDDARYMGVYRHDFAGFWLAQHHGAEMVASEVQDGTWTVEADLPGGDALQSALALAQNAEPGVERVTVTVPGFSGEPVEISLDDYVHYADQAERDAATVCMATLEFRHKATRAGVCLLTEQDVEFAVVVLSRLLIAGQTELVPPLRRVRLLARTHGMSDLARIATAAIATLRTGDTDSVLNEIEPRLAARTLPELPASPAITVHLSKNRQTRHCDG